MYIVPLSRDGTNNWFGQLKLTADVGEGMKLMAQGLLSKSEGTNNNNSGNSGIFGSPESIGEVMNRVSYISGRLFATDYWAPSTIKREAFAGKFTHVINPMTFYEVTVSSYSSKFDTNPGRFRDTSTLQYWRYFY
jgi:hypothetical protein